MKLLGVEIEDKLNSNQHTSSILKNCDQST